MESTMARNLMTFDVVTIPPGLPVMTIARLLWERRISAVPVIADDGALLGIVTEADLVRRLAATADKPPSWFTPCLLIRRRRPTAMRARTASWHRK